MAMATDTASDLSNIGELLTREYYKHNRKKKSEGKKSVGNVTVNKKVDD